MNNVLKLICLWIWISISLSAQAQSKKLKIDSLSLIGEKDFPFEAVFNGTAFGGISGIDRAPNGDYYLISDDKSQFSPARFYIASLFFDENRFDSVKIREVVFLKQPDSSLYPVNSIDAESIRFYKGNLYRTSEGAEKTLIQPSIQITDSKGNYIKNIPLNEQFRYYPDKQYGLRPNEAIEGSCFTPGTNRYWIMNEAPFYQDGPEPALHPGKYPVRLTQINPSTGKVKKQYAYLLDAVAKPAVKAGGEAMNSVSEILALSKKQFLVLERGYSQGRGNTVKLYLADIAGADNIKKEGSLERKHYKAVSKRLLLNFSETGLKHIDNIEGMSLGPVLPNGNPSLIFVSDDNFNPSEITQFIAFEIHLKK